MPTDTTTTTTTTTTTPSTTPVTPATPGTTTPADSLMVATDPREQAAYDATLPIARALDEKQMVPLNLDAPEVASKCFAVFDAMKEHRSVLAALPDFDIASYDGLETAALALTAAHGYYLSATVPPDSLADLIERGTQLRRSLYNWSLGLADAGIVDGAKFANAPMGNGFLEVATGLTALVMAYRSSNWVAVKDNSALTDAMLAEAEADSQRIMAITGRRNLNPERIAEAADIRQRMFTICVNRYDQVRRAAAYMRWSKGDVDEIAPSLYAKGPRKKADKTDEKNQEPAKSSEPAKTGTPVGPLVAPTGKTDAGPVGTPDSSPFVTTM